MSGNIITLSGANYVPAGAIMPFAMATAPVGWISCDGSSLSRTTYNTLFLAIGTTWGNVDINTFNVPNLNGKTLVQYDASQTEFNAIAKTGGENTHTLGVTEIPSHNHGGAASGSFSGTTDSGGAGGDNVSSNTKRGTSAGSSFNSSEIATTGDSHTHSYSGSVSVGIASQGGSVAHNNLQPYAVIKYCIKT
jgi:microcystin-dependent protein